MWEFPAKGDNFLLVSHRVIYVKIWLIVLTTRLVDVSTHVIPLVYKVTRSSLHHKRSHPWFCRRVKRQVYFICILSWIRLFDFLTLGLFIALRLTSSAVSSSYLIDKFTEVALPSELSWLPSIRPLIKSVNLYWPFPRLMLI